MNKTVFVILNYFAYEETIECVKSIEKNCKAIEYEIVIVENGSTNESYSELLKNYGEISYIHLIKSEKNEGFAIGNNIGYEYAKKNIKPEFIVCLNSDTRLETDNFMEKVFEIYTNKKFHVLGPDVYSMKNKNHQNPHLINNYEYDSLLKFMKLLKIEKKLIWGSAVLRTLNLYDILKSKITKKINIDWTKELENVVLHGSCLIFSIDFIEKMEYAFYPKTFLYFEECILKYICEENNFKTLYSPNIKILHYEDVSTNVNLKSNLSRCKNFTNRHIDSVQIMIDLILKNKK